MAPSRSPLTRQSIVDAMTGLLGPAAVDTRDEQLRQASVDRFRKYTAVHGIYDGPIPAAIVYPSSTAEVASVLAVRRAEPRQHRAADPEGPPPKAAWRRWSRTASWWTVPG